MERAEIQQFLSKMRQMSDAYQQNSVVDNTAGEKQVEFSSILKDALEKVNETQMESSRLKTDFDRGVEGVDLAEVMVASQKANIAFQAVVHVRNRVVSAYQEIMNMPI